ncbi:MAG: hypothetical protein V8Q27_10260 [Eubacteriales bacterium]
MAFVRNMNEGQVVWTCAMTMAMEKAIGKRIVPLLPWSAWN